MEVSPPKAPQKISDPEELMELKDWWNKHGNQCSTILLVALLCVAGVKYWTRYQDRRADRASQEASVAMDVASLEKVVADYPSSGDAPVALLRSAYMTSREGTVESLELAQEKYTAFLKKYGRHELAPLARLGLAFTDEALGNFEKAEKAYAAFLSEHSALEFGADAEEKTGTVGDGHYLIPSAILGRARSLALQGQGTAAQTALDQFIAAMPNTEWAVMADELKASIDRLEFKAPMESASKNFGDALDLMGGAVAPVEAASAEAAPAQE